MYNGKKIILDFDGTIFRLFANYDLTHVITDLSLMFAKYNIKFDLCNDIFDSFHIALNLNDEMKKKNILFEIKNILTQAE